MRGLSISVFALFILTGCETFVFQQYPPSQRNIDAINATLNSGRVSSIAVGDFSANTPNQFEMVCGVRSLIKTPNETPFEKYIRAALIDELKRAGAYKLDQIEADRVITGHLDRVMLNTEAGSWDIDLTITFKTGESFTVSEAYQYDDFSCPGSAAAFVPAVQDLIFKIISHPIFQARMNLPAR